MVNWIKSFVEVLAADVVSIGFAHAFYYLTSENKTIRRAWFPQHEPMTSYFNSTVVHQIFLSTLFGYLHEAHVGHTGFSGRCPDLPLDSLAIIAVFHFYRNLFPGMGHSRSARQKSWLVLVMDKRTPGAPHLSTDLNVLSLLIAATCSSAGKNLEVPGSGYFLGFSGIRMIYSESWKWHCNIPIKHIPFLNSLALILSLQNLLLAIATCHHCAQSSTIDFF